MEADRFSDIVTQAVPYDLKLYLPKFKFDTSIKLEKNNMDEMGMPDAFYETSANLTGMYDFNQVGRNFFTTHITHKTCIAADEKGIEAAAARVLLQKMSLYLWKSVSTAHSCLDV